MRQVAFGQSRLTQSSLWYGNPFCAIATDSPSVTYFCTVFLEFWESRGDLLTISKSDSMDGFPSVGLGTSKTRYDPGAVLTAERQLDGKRAVGSEGDIGFELCPASEP